MISLYKLAYKIWDQLPPSLKSFVRNSPALNKVKGSISNSTGRFSPHDDVYNEAYFVNMDEKAQQGAEIIASHIVEYFQPSTVLDVGCGTGTLLQCLIAKQVAGKGLEYSEAALKICRERGLNVQKFDLENDELSDFEKVDVVISTEVAEHLPESGSDRYINLLCSVSNIVIFTAATPGQGGVDHVNEQPHQYWIIKFASRKFVFDEELSLKWRTAWSNTGMPFWYHQNLMIFRHSSD